MTEKRFASIDVGSFELEIGIYEIHESRGIRLLDSVRHVIALGSDTYNTGVISYGLVQEMISTLKDFTDIMKTYRCSAYRAIATSAMREAENSAIVLDQIRTRTGIAVQIISNAEQRMLSLKALSVRGQRFDALIAEGTAIVEMGFGSMQITLYDRGTMVSTQNLRLGALRIRDTLERLDASREAQRLILEEMVDHELDIYCRLHLGKRKIRNMIAVGDPIRILYDRLMRKARRDPVQEDSADRNAVRGFYEYVTERTNAQLERGLGLSAESAGVLVPTAIVYRRVLEAVDAQQVWFAGTRLIDGLAAEYALNHRILGNSHDFDADIISAVSEISARYGEGTAHRQYAVRNTLKIFDALRKPQGFQKRDRLLLQIAALLHHCGRFINMGRASLSSCDIIHATELVGLSRQEHELIAQILKNEEEQFRWSGLPMQVAKFTAIIRLADALDRSAKQKAGAYKIRMDAEERLIISTDYPGDMTLERLSFEQSKILFSSIFGIEPVFRQKRRKVS